jgi:hypothetical protein
MGQNNDPREHGDQQGQQGSSPRKTNWPAPVPGEKSRDGVSVPGKGEVGRPGQSQHDERTDPGQPKD